MIWKPCILKVKIKNGEDALKNPVYEWQTVLETVARHTPWTNEQITVEDREVTRNEQRFIIPVPYRNFPKCDQAVMDGHALEICQVIDLSPRWTVIQVRAYKE